MAVESISLAGQLQWISQDDVTLEYYSFSLHTGVRGGADWADEHAAMVTFWSSLVGAGILNGATLRTTRLNNWETSGGFTGWHQQDSLPQAVAGGGSSRLPTQLAVVISLLNTVELSVNLGRRRSRCYLGPCPAGIIGGDGKITTGNVTDIENAVQALHTDLVAIGSGVSGMPGLTVVSPTQPGQMVASVYGVGRQMDTHRSRRQKAVEGINYQVVV